MNRRTWLGLSMGAVGAMGPLAAAGTGQDAKARETLENNRARNLGRLKEYALAGKFPRNVVQRGMTPIFYDPANDVACAVGHLMIQDGKKDVVLATAKDHNSVRIPDLVDGPVVDWISTSGLTQEECSLIQPGYEFQERERAQVAAAVTPLIQMHLERVHLFLASVTQTEHGIDLALRRLQAAATRR